MNLTVFPSTPFVGGRAFFTGLPFDGAPSSVLIKGAPLNKVSWAEGRYDTMRAGFFSRWKENSVFGGRDLGLQRHVLSRDRMAQRTLASSGPIKPERRESGGVSSGLSESTGLIPIEPEAMVSFPDSSISIPLSVLQDLKLAQQKKYFTVRMALSRSTPDRLVIFLGEAHANRKEALPVRERLLRYFTFRGLEGGQVQKTLGGRFLGLFLEGRDLIFTFIRPDSVGSATDAALDSVPLHTVNEGVAVVADNGEETAGKVVMPHVINIHLEEGHRPDFYEHLASLVLPLFITSIPVSGAMSILASFFPALSTVSRVMTYGAAFFSVLSMAGFLADQLELPLPQSRILALLDSMRGLALGRNKTMTRNTVKALNDHPERPVILNIVGKPHAHGMMEILIEEFGFEEILF